MHTHSCVDWAVVCGHRVRMMFRRLRHWLCKPRWLPEELANARLALVEKTFFCKGQLSLVARVDQAYSKAGTLTLVDLKLRYTNKVYLSDVIELSAQRAAIKRGSRYQVSDRGYVLIQSPVTGRRMAHPVALMTDEELMAVAQRRIQILNRAVAPSGPASSANCRRCEYQSECTSQFAGDETTAKSK